AGELLYIPYSANIGLRRVFTDVVSTGWLQPPGGIAATELAMKNAYNDTLGSANIGFAVLDDLLVRFSVADVMSRPRISDLSAATKINTGDATGRSGNVLLEPFRARQYDISVEWYATDTDYISGAVFYKDIESFIVRSTESRVIFRPDLGQDVTYDISLPNNGEGGEVKGFEIGFTKTFGFLGEKFSGLGLSGSYTYADSETSNQNIVTGEPLPLEDLSEKSYNIVSFYEYEGFSARLAYNWRSEFLDKTQGFNQQPEIERDRSQIDFSASYKLTKKVKVSFNAINLGDDANDQYQLLEERDYKKSTVGRRYTINISARL
ncbi:MAG: TonB-dependent receptor domain-containing protein, partial [Cycloclasticus pugetii]